MFDSAGVVLLSLLDGVRSSGAFFVYGVGLSVFLLIANVTASEGTLERRVPGVRLVLHSNVLLVVYHAWSYRARCSLVSWLSRTRYFIKRCCTQPLTKDYYRYLQQERVTLLLPHLLLLPVPRV
ncbi:hypothetical protein NDU88_002103 [Pleurodeles waltl]|uniref:Uncharacterized protein n=1 Tax=Pleurodeles waltl TaxID=8319 RepID=A0AAV7UYT4_PLEWA|nr:hypothetical protein NDU88_002103 [Pleurodeles waltl]